MNSKIPAIKQEKNIKKYLKILSELGKVRITFFVAISASAGYILAAGELSSLMILPVLGVFILSCASAALNQYQESDTDALMRRTRHRPLPQSTIKRNTALIMSIGMAISGLAILLFSSGLVPFVLGIAAVIWYNAVYTPMKKKTAMAVMPGAFIGAIPPAIGWAAGGGSLASPEIWAFSAFIFIWQIPHFWLLLLIYEEDYRNAGFPILTDIFSHRQLTRLTYLWILVLAASSFSIPLFAAESNLVTLFILAAAGLWLVWRTKSLAVEYYQGRNYMFAFREVNVFVLLVVVLMTVDKLI